jgi:hypothetical protein
MISESIYLAFWREKAFRASIGFFYVLRHGGGVFYLVLIELAV